MMTSRHTFRIATGIALCVGLPTLAFAASNDALENVLVSKRNGVTTVQIWPACQMDYQGHTPTEAGTELRISVRAGSDCAELLSEVSTEMYRRSELRLANIKEITFDKVGGSGEYISLFFSAAQKFDVRQHPVGWIEIDVDMNVASTSLAANAPPPLRAAPSPPAPLPALVTSIPAVPASSRRPQPARQQVAPSATGDFVIQLGVFSSTDDAIAQILRTDTDHFAYTTEFTVNGKTWHGLQLGFFESETAAETVLGELRKTFPDSWVRYVDRDEAALARASGELRAGDADQVPAVQVARTAPIDSSELQSLMAGGREALLAQQYPLAISRYTTVLQYPDHPYRADARENIGIAFERHGQPENSLAEYRAYIAEFPDNDATARVGDRLTSLQTAIPAPKQTAIAPPRTDTSEWNVLGGISQYYWRNQEQLVHDGNNIVNSSGVLAMGDLTATRSGERFDVLARFNGAYQFNLVEFDDRGNIGWVSDAYISINDRSLNVEGRLGRQKRRSDGVLGRFDGVAADYHWKPGISISASAGLPIESPRYISGSQRAFYAGAVHFDDLWDQLGISAYTHQQTVDGISDRQAIGSNLRYRNGPLQIVGLIDYDLSYGVLNSALVNANWRLANDWQVYGMFDFGAQPYLTTRNALIGQSATTIDELLGTYTEGQVRRLARDRTAQSHMASVGVTIPLRDRFKLKLDVSTRQSEGTAASGGVAAMPATGSQIYYNATLLSTDLLRQGGLTMLTTRYDSTRTRDSLLLLFDTRLPLGDALRINPRIQLRQISRRQDDTEQLVATPSLRVLYRWKKLMLDLEAGGHWSSRDLALDEFDPFTPEGTEVLLGGFVRLGYRLEF